ncbi:sensor histidine kinase [Agromyces sp. MMS24-JH15]|uniref:sensor histidine kinase n=1 Tax=Agromyces sp. MMS24-JH15 TaxID=3243765 RepID=UPI003748A0AA
MEPGRERLSPAQLAILVGVFVLSVVMEVTGFLATPSADREEVSYATLHAVVPAVFLVCAGVAWRIGPTPMPARLMVTFAVLWIPQSFYQAIEQAGWLWPILLGVDLGWAVAAGILVLVYPRGWLDDAFDRWVAGIALVASFVNLLGKILLAGPGDAPCECAPNPYQIAELPGLYTFIDSGYRLIGAALLLAIAVRLLVRWVRGSVPARIVAFLMPLAILIWGVTVAAQAVTYAASTTADMVLRTVSLFAMASIPVSFVAGISHTRNLRGRVADLMRITREGTDRGLWADSLARVLRDASVRVYWWDEERGAYIDADGELAEPTDVEGRSAHSILPVSSPQGVPIALIRHDRVLTENSRLLEGVSSALRLSVDNGRLRSEVERTLQQVRDSRQRIVEAGVEARRRIERDLHDGAQQQLVALGMKLRVAANRAGQAGQPELKADLEDAIAALNQGLRELRELAHGIHPSLLVTGGLTLAVPELAGRSPVPVEVDVQAEGRLPEIIESTAYFAIAEFLANVGKHSHATRAWVRAHVLDGELLIVVRDNGRGGASLDAGSGVQGIVDRIDAVGGTLELESPAGAGTTVTVRIPLRGSLLPA